jgi:hypothetical protein
MRVAFTRVTDAIASSGARVVVSVAMAMSNLPNRC